MKFKKLALAVAAMSVGFAAQAAGTVNIGGVAHNVVYLAGASAPDNFLADIAEGMMTGITYYTASNYRAFAGTTNGLADAGLPDGTKVLFIKRSAGGSVFGVNPVARAQRIKTINVNSCTGGAGTKASPFTCAIVGVDPGEAGHAETTNAGLVADFGVSDVEPAMFQGPYNTENDTEALSAAETARLAATPINQIMMGIVATNNVPASTYLSRAAYGAMLSNQIQTWDLVDPSLDGDVVVCRRVEGSGTQTSYNWYFNNFPCSPTGATEPARMTDSYGWKESGSGTSGDPYIINPRAGYTVVENSSSGDVRNCLKAANAGTDHSFSAWDPDEQKTNFFKVTFGPQGEEPAAPRKAIGVLSLDSYTSATSTNGWSFRPIDGAGTYSYDSVAKTLNLSAGATGVAPTKSNLIEGKYDFVVELSMQSRSVAVVNEQGDNVAPIAGVQAAFGAEFIKRAGSPTFTGNFNNTGTKVSTPEAFASLPQFWAGTDSSSLYVSKYTREANTCKPLQYKGN